MQMKDNPTHILPKLNYKTIDRCIYFEALELLVNGLKSRFDQPGYKIYTNLENLLFKVYSFRR